LGGRKTGKGRQAVEAWKVSWRGKGWALEGKAAGETVLPACVGPGDGLSSVLKGKGEEGGGTHGENLRRVRGCYS